ncbi:MAG: TfoX/Sxy family DNA transformation protein [Bacteroidales bacterium]|jgi:DNA transformation protein|nr:TfoX/Sxy family DNA transformation protein [Bacteroidales bacterium]MDY0161398.1 TfoX/Sxy family DNA transformation protein [Bacteroidales bacterium]
MTLLLESKNIGKVLELKLHSLGIETIERLRELGTEETFRQLKKIDRKASRALLFAIEGAIQDVRWHNLDEDRKTQLRDFYDEMEKKLNL